MERKKNSGIVQGKQVIWKLMLLLVVLCCGMTACGSRGNTLMEGAAVGSSALSVYYYDGKDTVLGHLYDEAEIQAVLDELSSVSVKAVGDWSPQDVTVPVYGLSMMTEDGYPMEALWSDGMWITQDGGAYRFDYDFAKLWSDHEWESVNTWTDQMVLPCQYALTHLDTDPSGNGAWDPTWMTPAEELITEEGHEIQLVQWGEDSVTVTLTNQSGQEWTFGEYYHLEVQLDGVWYRVPTAPGQYWMVHDLAYVLQDGGSMDMTYSLVCYGKLPAGHYRLVAEAFEEGLTVEMDVEASVGQ